MDMKCLDFLGQQRAVQQVWSYMYCRKIGMNYLDHRQVEVTLGSACAQKGP